MEVNVRVPPSAKFTVGQACTKSNSAINSYIMDSEAAAGPVQEGLASLGYCTSYMMFLSPPLWQMRVSTVRPPGLCTCSQVEDSLIVSRLEVCSCVHDRAILKDNMWGIFVLIRSLHHAVAAVLTR